MANYTAQCAPSMLSTMATLTLTPTTMPMNTSTPMRDRPRTTLHRRFGPAAAIRHALSPVYPFSGLRNGGTNRHSLCGRRPLRAGRHFYGGICSRVPAVDAYERVLRGRARMGICATFCYISEEVLEANDFGMDGIYGVSPCT